jgi:hypothetical protein
MKALLLASLFAAVALPGSWAQEAPASTHQQRMAAIQAWGEANAAAFDRRMAAMDRSHQRFLDTVKPVSAAEEMSPSDAAQRRFINSIQGESTVVTPSGLALQVDNSHQRYFVDEASGRYVGGDAHADLDSLRGAGLDPDDYVEAQVRY